jgi:chemotaxis protein methyltransferase WspC
LVYSRIAALLKERMGLDAASIGVDSVQRAVRDRLAARGLDDEHMYWNQLNGSEQELQELIDTIVIPETWFFRDPEAFATLVRMVREEWLPKHPEGVLRILSLPCSTGEEPFSIAMTLLDSGLSPFRFHIEAVDISARALARAERAIYGKNSFRTKDLGFRERYFEPVEGAYQLRDSARQRVQFRQGNLLDPDGLRGTHGGARGYDAIFCRNVLIYFDRATQHRAVDVLGRLLTPAGILFVGPSETALLLECGLASSGVPLAFAFRKAGAPVAPRRITQPAPATAAARKYARPKARKAAPIAKGHAKPTDAEQAGAASEHWMERARDLANQGKLVEALACCDDNLRSDSASAEAFYLIGLLHDAAGRGREAADHYRKALYLDPQHPEALAHLAVVLQKEGDAQGAKRLLDRANRHSRRGAGNDSR